MENNTVNYNQSFEEITNYFITKGYTPVEAHNMAYQAKLYAERSKQLEQMRRADLAKTFSDFRKMKR